MGQMGHMGHLGHIKPTLAIAAPGSIANRNRPIIMSVRISALAQLASIVLSVTLECLDFCYDHESHHLLGGPGSGKSTCL